eukprot:2515026-Prymnesium_polylepis.1
MEEARGAASLSFSNQFSLHDDSEVCSAAAAPPPTGANTHTAHRLPKALRETSRRRAHACRSSAKCGSTSATMASWRG